MCHHLERMPAWSEQRDAELRASDAERERVVEALRKHAGAGRLVVEELEQRVAGAYRARTRADLEALLADLPVLRVRQGAMSGRWTLFAPARLAALAALLTAIWALSGGGYFWPLWPLLGTLWFAGPFGWRHVHGRRRQGHWSGPTRWTGPGRIEG